VNIPNLISLGRLLSVPILVWAIMDGRMELAFWLFIAAGISDAADGYIAKRLGAQSELGSYLDPLADKALLVSIYLALGAEGYLPNWLVIVVVWRDVLIIGGAMLYHTLTHSLKMEPLLISKVNTVAQIVLAGYVMGSHAFGISFDGVSLVLIWTVAATTVLSGAVYVVGWLRKATSMEGEA
jgi:cardiolipin synthase